MAVDKKCILLDGGKKIKLSNASMPSNEGIKITKDGNGNWLININVVISKDEANDVIFTYNELEAKFAKKYGRLPYDANEFEAAFPNMPYFSAFNEAGESRYVELDVNSDVMPIYDRDFGGTITLKLNIADFGKTQGAAGEKTQGAAGNH